MVIWGGFLGWIVLFIWFCVSHNIVGQLVILDGFTAACDSSSWCALRPSVCSADSQEVAFSG